MGTVIFYFSGTGNSLVTARRISDKLEDAEVVPIPEYMENPREISAERIGIVFPVYIWGPPNIVRRFTDKLTVSNSPYVFGVATYGGFPGSTLSRLKKMLKENSIELDCGFGVQMPGNYTPLYGAVAREKQEKIFNNAEEKIGQIVDYVKSSNTGRIETSFFLANWIFSGVIYPLAIKKMEKEDEHFRVLDSCTGCRICEKVCPVENINIKDSRPVWSHRCEQCMACLQWCPEEAIQYKTKTEGRTRYHHPEVDAEDFFSQRTDGNGE